jgi:protein SCO1
MTLSQMTPRSAWLIFALLFVCNQASSESLVRKPLPPDSAYNLKVSLENHEAAIVALDEYRGHPVVVSMFYASCPNVCPMLVSTIRITEDQLLGEMRSGLRVLMISVDPERDTPKVLQESLSRYKVDPDRWSMVRPEAGDVRAIAAVFGIKYKQLPNGEFNHSTRLILLDRQGIPIADSEQLGSYDPAFLDAIENALKSN